MVRDVGLYVMKSEEELDKGHVEAFLINVRAKLDLEACSIGCLLHMGGGLTIPTSVLFRPRDDPKIHHVWL